MSNGVLLLLISILTNFVFAYENEEVVNDLFSKIKNIREPSQSDLILIQEFLSNGDRPYLKPIGILPNKRNARNLLLIGEEGEMPFYTVYHFGDSETSDRCIMLYSSYNYPYPGKLQLLVKEIRKSGYKGDVIARIGGYPNMQFGGLKFCHIPYSWKLASLLEGKNLGYRYVVWLDLAMHPLNNLENIFHIIKKKGYFFTSAGFNLDYPYKLGHHIKSAVEAMGLNEKQLRGIKHVSSQIIGIDTFDQRINNFLIDWKNETEKVIPCMNWYPEELSYSVAAWRSGLKPLIIFGDLVFTKDNYHNKGDHTRWFFWDQNRENDPQWDPSVLKNKI